MPPNTTFQAAASSLIGIGVCATTLAQTPELVLREGQQIQVDATPRTVQSINRFAAWGHDSYLIIAAISPVQDIVWGSLNGSAPSVYGVEDGQAPGEPDHFRLRDGLSIVAPATGTEAAVFLGDGEGTGGFLMSLRRGLGEVGREGVVGPSTYPWTFFAAPVGTRNDEVWFLGGTVDETDPHDPRVIHSITTGTALYKATPSSITRVIGGGDTVTGMAGTTLIPKDAMTRLYDVSDDGSHWIGVAPMNSLKTSCFLTVAMACLLPVMDECCPSTPLDRRQWMPVLTHLGSRRRLCDFVSKMDSPIRRPSMA